ncbi:MAG: hypothetical protein RI897_1969, partial [Verrucomicrobiota bacterium]
MKTISTAVCDLRVGFARRTRRGRRPPALRQRRRRNPLESLDLGGR